MFEHEREMIPDPWKHSKRWLHKYGEDCWDALCDATPGIEGFFLKDHAQAYAKHRPRISSKRINLQTAIKEMRYLLRLGEIQQPPACKRLGRKWYWIGPEETTNG